jgi:opacity protein-like surface antigen
MRRLHLLAALALAVSAAAPAQAAEQVRPAAPFSSISVQGPISVTVDAGTAQSLTVRGNDQFVQGLVSEVVDGELRLRMRDKHFSTTSGEQRILITLPALRAFRAEGAGEIKLNKIRGERLDVDYRGAGSMDINGAVKSFKMKAEGVGQVDAKALIANNADIQFRGVGEVQVYASDRLDAVVQGMGSLRYYGKPRTVNKSAAGLGTVSAGD